MQRIDAPATLFVIVTALLVGGGGTPAAWASPEYATYFGGAPGETVAFDVVVEASGDVLIAGVASPGSLPAPTVGGRDHSGGRYDAFLARFDPTLSALRLLTYLGGGGDDRCFDIELLPGGAIALVGQTNSPDFPITQAAAFEPNYLGEPLDGFLTVLNKTGTNVIYSSFFGGDKEDAITSIAQDVEGRLLLAGYTTSCNLSFPQPQDCQYQPTNLGGVDNFLYRLTLDIANPTNSVVDYGTYLGGADDENFRDLWPDPGGRQSTPNVLPGSDNSVTLVGKTSSAGTFPVNAPRQGPPGDFDIFVTRLNLDPGVPRENQLEYSILIGGDDFEGTYHAAVADNEDVLLTGTTWSANFPTTSGAAKRFRSGLFDAFLLRLRPVAGTPDQLVYSTYLGGTAGDAGRDLTEDVNGRVILVGHTNSNGSLAPASCPRQPQGNWDNFLAVMEPDGKLAYAEYSGGVGGDFLQLVAQGPGDSPTYLVGTTGSAGLFVHAGAFQPQFTGPGLYMTRTAVPEPATFTRGECNGDGMINIADAVCILNWLFAGTATPDCVASTNTNGDQAVDLADGVSLLNFLFGGGSPPAEPFPQCGPSCLQADKDLGCAEPTNCNQ